MSRRERWAKRETRGVRDGNESGYPVGGLTKPNQRCGKTSVVRTLSLPIPLFSRFRSPSTYPASFIHLFITSLLALTVSTMPLGPIINSKLCTARARLGRCIKLSR